MTADYNIIDSVINVESEKKNNEIEKQNRKSKINILYTI